MISVAIGVTAVQWFLGEVLVMTTLPIEDKLINELYIPAKQLAVKNDEIEHINWYGGKLTIVSK